jgi:hypothetical protein
MMNRLVPELPDTLARAIDVLTEVHTRDDRAGFVVTLGASPYYDAPHISADRYLKAWATLRAAIGKQISPNA